MAGRRPPLTREELRDGVPQRERFPREPGWPKTRGECVDGPRPCPWVACRYHLLVDTKHVGHGREIIGALRKNRKFDEDSEDSIAAALEAIPDTCALDVASRGPSMQTEIAELLGCTHQRVEQIEYHAKNRLQVEILKRSRK